MSGKREIITLKRFREMINSKDFDKYEYVPVVYAKDDEGNGFDRILFTPSILTGVGVDNDPEEYFKKAICIN